MTFLRILVGMSFLSFGFILILTNHKFDERTLLAAAFFAISFLSSQVKT